jgi:hypothetical protein
VKAETVHLAVVSTPRSGNCWLRHMLAEALELEHIIVHDPSEVSWESLPARAILQLHWLPEEPFVSLLARHEFGVLVLARHPLDALISILAFSQHDESTLRWLNGAGGDERSIAAARPLDEAFLAYATGPRARSLLGVSARWWRRAGVARVRYEDLVDDAPAEFTRIVESLGAVARRSPAEVAAASTPADMRAQNVHMLFHVWQARRDLWRAFLTAPAAQSIFAAQREAFDTLGYACDPDESLAAADAQLNWDRYDAGAVKRHLHGVKRTLCDTQTHLHHQFAAQRADIESQRAALERQQADLARQQAGLALQAAGLGALRLELDALRARQAELDSLGPWSLGAARRLQRVSRRFPRLAATVKSAVSLGKRQHPSKEAT